MALYDFFTQALEDEKKKQKAAPVQPKPVTGKGSVLSSPVQKISPTAKGTPVKKPEGVFGYLKSKVEGTISTIEERTPDVMNAAVKGLGTATVNAGAGLLKLGKYMTPLPNEVKDSVSNDIDKFANKLNQKIIKLAPVKKETIGTKVSEGIASTAPFLLASAETGGINLLPKLKGASKLVSFANRAISLADDALKFAGTSEAINPNRTAQSFGHSFVNGLTFIGGSQAFSKVGALLGGYGSTRQALTKYLGGGLINAYQTYQQGGDEKDIAASFINGAAFEAFTHSKAAEKMKIVQNLQQRAPDGVYLTTPDGKIDINAVKTVLKAGVDTLRTDFERGTVPGFQKLPGDAPEDVAPEQPEKPVESMGDYTMGNEDVAPETEIIWDSTPPAKITSSKVDRNLGLKPDQTPVKSTEPVMLRKQIRDEARGAKAGYAAGKEEIKTLFREKVAGVQEIKAKIVDYVKENVPAAKRGRFLTNVRDAKTLGNLEKAFAKVDKITQVDPLMQETSSAAMNLIKPGTETDYSGMTTEQYKRSQVERREAARKEEYGGIRERFNRIRETFQYHIDRGSLLEKAQKAQAMKNKAIVRPEYRMDVNIDRLLGSNIIGEEKLRQMGFEDLTQSLGDMKTLEDFNQYMQAKRNVFDLRDKGMLTGRDAIMDEKIVREDAARFAEPEAKVRQMQDQLLDFLVDNGLKTKEQVEQLRRENPNYVSFMKVFSPEEQEMIHNGVSTLGSMGEEKVIKRMKGSERANESFFVSFPKVMNWAVKEAQVNKIAGIMVDSIKEGNPFGLTRLKEGQTPAGKYTMSRIKNGKVERYAVSDPLIGKAIKNLTDTELGLIGQILNLPTRLLKLGATGINPAFGITNPVRDVQTAFMNSKQAGKMTSKLVPAIVEAFKPDPEMRQRLREGGLGQIEADAYRQDPLVNTEKVVAKQFTKERLKFFAKHPSDWVNLMENIVGFSEQIPRTAAYKAKYDESIKSGMQEQDARALAELEYNNITGNFRRSRLMSSAVRLLGAYLPASIQGTRSTLRAMTPDKAGGKTSYARPLAGYAGRLAFPMAATLLLTAFNNSDDEKKKVWEDLSESEKENNFLIIPDDVKNVAGKWEGVIKIPKSQELRSFLKVGENALSEAFDTGKLSWVDVADAVVNVMTPFTTDPKQIASTTVPTAVRPSIENIFNIDFFTGKQVVSDKIMSQYPDDPSQQFNERTSAIAKKVGEALNISPIKVDHFMKGHLGSVGDTVANTLDNLLYLMGSIPKTEVKGKGVAEQIKGRFSGAYGGELENQFYDIQNKETTEKNVSRREAAAIFESLKGKSKDQVLAEVSRMSPEDQKKLTDYVKYQKEQTTRTQKTESKISVTKQYSKIQQLIKDGKKEEARQYVLSLSPEEQQALSLYIKK